MELFKEYNVRKILYPEQGGRVHINFTLPVPAEDTDFPAVKTSEKKEENRRRNKRGKDGKSAGSENKEASAFADFERYPVNKAGKGQSNQREDSARDGRREPEGDIIFPDERFSTYSVSRLLDTDMPVRVRISEYYFALASRLASGLRGGDSAVIGYRITYSSDRMISFLWECMIYRDRLLVRMHPFSQTWDTVSGYMLPLRYFSKRPGNLIKLCPGSERENFYLNGSGLTLYSCSFREGDGIGLRRSSVHNFLHEVEIPASKCRHIED